jgi:hypothetical protein
MQKCIISGCENTDDKGVFYECLCGPCYEYLCHNAGCNSQAERNELELVNLRKELRKDWWQRSDRMGRG